MPAPEPGQRWGILGGTFDPVHLGHVTLGLEILKDRRLDGVLLVPSFDPPHRERHPHATFQHRLNMLRLACEQHTCFEACPIEEELERPSYSLQTIRALKKRYPEVDFRFIIGADNLALLKTWHRWEEFLDEVQLLVGGRPGTDPRAMERFPGARVEVVATSLIDISATSIRQAVRSGLANEDLRRLVPRPVAEYIIDEGLYL